MSTAETLDLKERGRSPTLPRALSLALRELRTGFGGFRVFIACIALGVMVITAVGALGDALRSGLERQGEMILGGDVTFSRMHARGEGSDRAWLLAQGRVSETATMRAMARRLDGNDQSLIELKAVDGAYPLVGAVKLDGGASLDVTVRKAGSIAVEPILIERLGRKGGDRVKIGEAEVQIAATIAAEPDGLADRVSYGPRVMMSVETLEATKLVQPGTLVRWRYALKLPPETGATAAGLSLFRDQAKRDLPESGFTVTDRRDPSPQVTRTLDRLRQFLTLLGLTALLVGGVGVANAVATFIDRRRKVIATFKSLGASSGLVFSIFFIQIMLMAVVGVLIGVVLGYAVPFVLGAVYGDALPIRAEFAVSGHSVLTALVYGLLVAVLFTLWPLGRAELIRAAVLFRDEVAPERRWPRPAIVAATVGVAAALVLFAVLSSESQRIALWFCGSVAVVFLVFIGLGAAVVWAARRVKRSRIPELALAVGNLGAPGGLTQSVVLSLGAGLSLLVAVALADNSLVSEMNGRLPEKSPDYFVLDIAKEDSAKFRALVEAQVPAARFEEAPMLRGRLIMLGDRPVETIKAPPEAQWVLNGDRGLTYSDTPPHNAKIVSGSWWGKDYDGEPLVSFDVDLAKKLDAKLGDTVTVNVLGRNVTARIANLREIDWESLTLNFVMVFSPNTLKGAPHKLLSTISLPEGTSVEAEARLARQLGREFPSVTAIRVKDAIAAFNAIYAKVMTAVRAAGSVTLLAGALVLAGALATAQRRRIAGAVILKTLGATRWRILASHAVEYLLLAGITALFAVGLGAAASYVAVTQVMEIPFTFSWWTVLQALAVATGLVILLGGIGTWMVLSARPAAYLRND